MSYESNFDYNGDVSRVSKITFGVMSPKMIRDQSVVQVIYHDTFCGNNPVTGGLFDPRMGVLEYGQVCTTDKQSNKDTPGYFGHIELSLPVFHIQYFPVVQKIVRCICYRCSSLLVPKNKYEENVSKKNKLSYVFDIAKKVKVCPNPECKSIQPDKIIKIDSCKIQAVWMTSSGNKESSVDIETRKLVYTPKYVLNLFEQISDKNCKKMGFNPKLSHPSWMVMTVFPVCPPSCRPSVHQDNGQRMEDDITIKYCDIIKYNRMIQDKLSTDPEAKIIDDWHNLLQYHVSTLIDNEIAGIPPAAQRSGRPLKGLRQRLKGKEGRIRGNLMGKRVNFSSRTVITPDPVIDLDELGVPVKIAVQLTHPEKVTASNIHELRNCIRNGCKVYPGARAVYKKKNRKTISLNHIDRYQFAQMLEVGDVVIRHIKSGDWVLFNRQPSLHKMSMMAHRIRILNGLTFRLNISATTPYNADFDGDEMNMHVPQSIAAANEIACLASVNKQIISPALNMPIITFVQDSVLGGHKMTMNITRKMNHREMMNALAWNSNYDGKMLTKDGFSGKDGLSYCIPDTTLRIKNRRGKYVHIKNGSITPESDVFDKKVFANLIHSIFRDNGANKCASFFNNAQHMIRSFLLKNSFSVGIRDLVLDDELNEEIEKAIQQQILEAEKIIQTLHLNMFENLTSDSNKVAFENKVNQKLTAARSCAENILKKCYDNIQTNRFMNMVDGGSKGKLINLAQMTACLGQQAIDGGRAPYGFDNRTLPHFEKYDDKSLSRGFVSNSFQKGVNPIEFFFHAMAGREGIIDTAVKSVTWDTTIIILENNTAKYVKIGEWIDNHLSVKENEVEKHQERNLELLNTSDIYIPTTDYEGNVTWGEVSALTRHDPGEKLFEIKTLSGRKVTVTANKSLLIWNKDTSQFKEKYSDDIQIGDCVPVTFKLSEPPVLNSEIQFSKYASHENYTESKIMNLDKETGKFLGTYIAIGKISFAPSIAHLIHFDFAFSKDETKQFCQKWIDETTSKFNISVSSLGTFMDNFIGGFKDKHIPDETFTAPKEFIHGMLSGIVSNCNIKDENDGFRLYFSNFTNFTEILGEKLATLFSRIGVYICIEKDHIFIANEWISTLYTELDIDHPYQFIVRSSQFKNHRKNNVVLDEIVEINVIGTENNPKMYDLTIPSTLNFGLASGLQVRDTSSTGYIQRKLMKALEDYKISWSGCVKDAQDDVVQFLFGDDNTDSTAMEYQSIPIIDQNDIHETYFMDCENNDKMKKYCDELEEMKKWYVESICEDSPEESVKFPVHIERIIRRIVTDNCLETSDKNTDLSPDFILTKYEELLKELENNHLNPGTWMAKFLLYMKAGPKRLIEELNMDKKSFLEFIKIFKLLYSRSRIEPGDAVGPVSAQSIGEPCTQLSCGGKTPVIVKQDGVTKTIKMAELIDKYLPPIVDRKHQHDVMPVYNLDCVGVSPTENVKWTNVTHVSRHPANGDMITIKTKTGKDVRATLSHSFLTRKDNRVVPVKGSELNIGDFVPCIRNMPDGQGQLPDSPIVLNKETGRFIGAVISEGFQSCCHGKLTGHIQFCQHDPEWIEDILVDFTRVTGLKHTVNKSKVTENKHFRHNHEYSYNGNVHNKELAKWMTDNFGRISHDKTLPAWILDAPKEFVSGLLQTAYDGDGSIEIKPRHHQIRYHSVSKELLIMMSMCLARFGIPSSMQEEDGKKPSGEYRLIYVLRFPMDYVEKFNEHIGFSCKEKNAKLKQLIHDRKNGPNPMRGNQFIIPETENVIKKIRDCVTDVAIRKEMARVCRKKGVTLSMLRRIKSQAEANNAPQELIDEVDQAINSDVFWDTITHIEIEKDSTEMVYDFTVNEELQSFALKNMLLVHNTLNSVTYETEILVRNSKKNIFTYQIGDFVEKNIKKNPNKTQYYKEKDTTWTPILDEEYYEVPSVDESGNVSWKQIEAVTQHPVVNKDGSNTLLKVKTEKEREVIATKAKSFLQVLDGKIQEAEGEKIAVGQHLLISILELDFEESDKESRILKSDKDYETIYEIKNGEQTKSKREGKYSDIYFDLIKSIEEVPAPTKYVYDLTVAETRNFNIKNGLAMRDTFHLSGVGGKANITRGVPRLQELFNLSKNPKNCSLTIRLPYPQGQDKEHVQRVSAEICQISIKSLLLNTKIVFESKKSEEVKKFHEIEEMFCSLYDEFPSSPWVLILSFDRKKILEMNVCLEEIYYSIKLAYPSGVHCEFTDDNAPELFLRIKIDKNNQELKKLVVPNVVPEITILNSICSKLVDDIIIRGIDSIQNVALRQDIRSLTNKEWLIDTDGSNIIDVILHPQVDGNRTISNDVNEMYQVFGIEAARQTLIREIREVMDEASEIDPRHIHLLVDMMTTKGKLIPIDRNGMKLTSVGPLGKCSFEEADQQLYKAAINGDTDYMTGVSANIILGQAPPCGTGTVDVKLDEEKLMEFYNNSVDIIEPNEPNVESKTSVSFDFDD